GSDGSSPCRPWCASPDGASSTGRSIRRSSTGCSRSSTDSGFHRACWPSSTATCAETGEALAPGKLSRLQGASMNTRLSVGIETNCTAPLQLERVGMRLFKLMGVDSLLLPDHYLSFVPRSVWNVDSTPAAKMVPSPDAFFDPFVMMGMMAARYRRVRIGTGVTESFRRHPATLAQAFVTIDHLTGGRAILGIGNGERENTAPYGMPFIKRVARLEEALTIIRKLWESRGEPVDFDGSIWRLRRALFATPLHDGKPPVIWVAAHAPKMLGLTGRFADGWYPTIKMTPAEYRQRLERIHTAAAAAGR